MKKVMIVAALAIATAAAIALAPAQPAAHACDREDC